MTFSLLLCIAYYHLKVIMFIVVAIIMKYWMMQCWEHCDKAILVGWGNVLKGEFVMDQIIFI